MWEMDPEWKYFMEIDLKDGFFGISVDERLSKLFGFTYGDRRVQVESITPRMEVE